MAELTCEICGAREASAIVLIEGAKLAACRGCARGGKKLYILEEQVGSTNIVIKEKRAAIAREEIVEDYAKIVRNAIAKEKVPLAVIAERINEKESYIHSIETGRLSPTIATARKLEKELNVRLVETITEDVTPISEKTPQKFKESTLEDILEYQKKNKKAK